jgi:L,D-peptidoglycan transpeptidase YkuD (ErfK/YbiS/YcfS/YnhG family)
LQAQFTGTVHSRGLQADSAEMKPKNLSFVASVVVIASLALLMHCSDDLATKLEELSIPVDVGQLVFVTSSSWTARTGTISRFERAGKDWKRSGPPRDVVLGRNGMGWGLGLHSEQRDGPLKVEGDGRSPAGVFELGTSFGYAASPPAGVMMPYRVIGENDFFVDDPQANDYNRWVTLSRGEDPEKYWASYETMLRPDGLYALGVVVRHNTDPAVAGRGSAIFLHLWRSPSAATSGCTAMSKEDLIELLAWLNPEKRPLLIQLPREELNRITEIMSAL